MYKIQRNSGGYKLWLGNNNGWYDDPPALLTITEICNKILK